MQTAQPERDRPSLLQRLGLDWNPKPLVSPRKANGAAALCFVCTGFAGLARQGRWGPVRADVLTTSP